ncbi:MAG TPA: NAD(P)/FAD-dependent oxidoreductase [Pirellulales bacterium]|nr:NAD(P)/FAD-dependent oxidoreductase [Pirellulales bacterium]
MVDGLPRVVIIGGGFAGLNAARALRRAPVQITLIDRRNHHLFQPLLYQVATAALNPSDIAVPIRRILRHQKNVEVLLAEAKSVDLSDKIVVLADEEISYDYLIVATGARHSYFGHEMWTPYAPGLKSIGDALEIRRRVLSAFELAERETDLELQRSWLTFVIVGGGPTGVELSGAICEIAQHALAHDFRHIDPKQARVILLESSDRVLKTFAPKLSDKARRQLEKLGVEVRTKKIVTFIDDHGVFVGGQRICARTVLWAAGVHGSRLGRMLGVRVDHCGRVAVEPTLAIPGHPEAFVVGDLSSLKLPDGSQVPGVAPAAIQEGRHAAKNIMRALHSQPPQPFKYRNKGQLATIGRSAGVAQFGRIKFGGVLAWASWLFVHVMFLIGFRNRFIVTFQWMWSYLSYDRGARLITGPLHRDPDQSRAERRVTSHVTTR